jgi:hypothetical protein
MNEEQYCGNCRYVFHNGGWLSCRRYPPSWRGDPKAGLFGSEFPTTNTILWCGEWAPQPLESSGNG